MICGALSSDMSLPIPFSRVAALRPARFECSASTQAGRAQSGAAGRASPFPAARSAFRDARLTADPLILRLLPTDVKSTPAVSGAGPLSRPLAPCVDAYYLAFDGR